MSVENSPFLNIKESFSNILSDFAKIKHFLPEEEETENTPNRIARMYCDELLTGYDKNPETILSKTFDSDNDNMVIVKEIPFVSLCAHHWLPFSGKAHIGYIPSESKKVVGLSKLPRLVQCFAKRFQIQENMTTQIADAIVEYLTPNCIVITEAQHLCAQIRGAQSIGTIMTCSAVKGKFEEKVVKDEFLSLIRN